ncbi:MAG: hypothetical protein IPI02_20035 [Sterolibacteriaceae bacterium]|nr:hypothetical protein [Sterolibacteriaceae bacterium]
MMLLLDGLYPNGPVLERCRDYHWQFMIVLKDDSPPTVDGNTAPAEVQTRQ